MTVMAIGATIPTDFMAKNNLFQSILDCLGAGVLAIDKGAKICFVNPSAQKMLGWPHDELIHQPVSVIIKDQSLEKCVTFFKKNGESFPIECLHGGSTIAFFDITERQRIEQQKDEFISNLSHELRSPLTIIKGAIWNLKDGVMGKLTEKQTKLVETTSRHIDNLSRLIEDVLEVSRLQSGKATIYRRRVNLLHLMEQVISDYHLIAKEKYIQLKADLPKELPFVYVDSDTVTQILHNLLNNALRFAKKEITITAEECLSHFVQVGVFDDGPGIAKEDQKKLFSKFEQLQRPSGVTGYKGTGLGLSICKEIVEQHQGKIWVESNLGEGAKFYFTLPQYDPLTDFRFALREALQEANTGRTHLALAVISLEHFYAIKGQKIEQESDSVLHEIEEDVKKSSLRKKDLLFRYALNDFVIILPHTPKEGAVTIATRVEQFVQEKLIAAFKLETKPVLHVGIVSYPNDATSMDRLVEIALERAKRGRDEIL